MQSKITDILKQANDKKTEIAELERSKKRASQELRTARSVKDAKGWRWKDDPPNKVRSMKDLPKHRTKGVEYIMIEQKPNINPISKLTKKNLKRNS